MSNQEVSLKPELILAAATHHLNTHFFEGSRDSAKQLFQLIADGKSAPFMRIDTGVSGEVLCELALDKTLHVGKLNFGHFRKNLAMMMMAVKKRIDAKESLNILSSQNGEVMFNIPGIVKDDSGQINVMVCSFRPLGPGLATVRLMYLDPEQYALAVKQANDAANQA